MRYNFKRYCKDPEKIENYEKAKKDDFIGWHCHHRLETHNSDGKRRDVDITQKELIALGMYYHRPAEELIFLTTREHNAFKKGKKLSDETRKKLSEANKGKKLSDETRKKMSDVKKDISDETRKKMSDAKKGKQLSDETKKKLSEARKGMHWYNNGKINVRVKECPEGFVPGMLR